jgi:hypothetical protein
MRTRTTLLLLFLVAALASFIWYWERHQQSTLQRRAAGSLTSLEVDKIDSMEIQNASGTAKMKRKPDNTWYLTDPFDDRVAPDFVQRLLDLANKAEIADTLLEKDVKDSDRRSYGLSDKEAITIAWRSGGKTVGKLKLGKIGALGDTVYAESPGHKTYTDIYLIWARPDAKSTNLRDEVARPLTDMRDLKLLPFSTSKIVSFSIRRPGAGGEMQVQRKLLTADEATPWTFTKPLKARGNQKRIDDFVGLFGTAQATKLQAPGSAPKDLPAAPAVELQFQTDPAVKGTIIRLYPPETPESASINGYLVDRKAWISIEKGYLDSECIPESPDKMRAPTLADLDAKKLTTMLIQTADVDPISLYRIGNRWLMQKADKSFVKASGDRVSKTIQALNTAEIGKFVTDSLTNPADFGLDTPWQTITFASAEHTPQKLEEVTPKNSIILQFGKGPDQRLYANFKGEGSVYLMLPEHYSLVPSLPMKWKDPQILSFSRPTVRRFQQTLGTAPPIILTSPPQSFSFVASSGGSNVSNLLIKEPVERILARLGSLNVSDWVSGLQEGHDALQTPALELELDIEYTDGKDPANFDAAKTKTVKLSFAPAGSAAKALFYIGSCTDISDYFLITREVFQELSAPLLKRE